MARNSYDDDDEIDNTFYIPSNFTDSGRILGGMFETRNAVEAVVVVVIIGAILWFALGMDLPGKLVVMGVVCIPIGVFALIGFQGDSITRFSKTLFLFIRNRKKMRYRRIKRNAEKDYGARIKATNKKTKSKAAPTRTKKEKERERGH